MADGCNHFGFSGASGHFEMAAALPGPPGPPGKSAYEAAVEGGYTGTEEQFNAALAEIDTALQPSDVDTTLSNSSENPVQNKVITAALDGKAPVITDTASGAVASFPDGADGLPLENLVVQVAAVQDLHGYDAPWPAGGSYNLLPQTSAGDETTNGIRFQTDGNGTIHISGTASENAQKTFDIAEVTMPSADIYVHILNNVANANVSFFFWNNGQNVGGITLGAINRIYKLTTLTGATFNQLTVIVPSGQTVDITLSPMLCLDGTVKPFLPYSNLCPFNGWTGANVARTGKNLFPSESYWKTGTLSPTTGEELIDNNYWRTDFIDVELGSQYRLSFDGSVLSASEFRVFTYKEDGTFINAYSPNVNNVLVFSGATKIRFRWLKSYNLTNIQLELGSTATDYEPYQGDTYSITFPTSDGTVYYASLNIKTGVMTVEGGVNVYNGVDSVNVPAPEGGVVNLGKVTDIGRAGPDYYSFYTTNIRIGNFGSSTARILTPQEMSDCGFLCSNMPLCTMFETGNPTTNAQYAVGARLTAAGNVRIYIYARADTGITTVKQMNAKLAEWYAGNTPFAYCFRLKTPFTVQLSPVQLFSSLYGVNNIWADCGPVAVEYPADTKLYIQKINAPSDDDMTADTQIASGKYFIIGGTLYLSTTTIPAGDTIIPGTNCTKTDLAAALNAINS